MKKIKILLIAIAALFGCYLMYSAFIVVRYRHHVEMFKYKTYLWILDDSVKNNVDTNMFCGYIGKKDILYEYVLKNGYYVSIWEFEGLKEVKLSEIPIKTNVDLSDVKIIPREVLDAKESPEINIKLGFSFNGSVSLNLGKQTKVIKFINTHKYIGFYGLVNKLSLSDGKGKHLILFDYPKGNEPTLFLLYKTLTGFYVVFVNSKNVRIHPSNPSCATSP